MKDRTREAASLLRLIAGIMLFIGMVVAFVLIMLGIASIASEDDHFAAYFLRTTGVLLIIYGFAVALGHLLIYALLNGFSVMVENSDRTVIEDALFEIANQGRSIEISNYPEDIIGNLPQNET